MIMREDPLAIMPYCLGKEYNGKQHICKYCGFRNECENIIKSKGIKVK
jgi:hypothetical protein